MTTKVVGLFDTISQAQTVSQELTSQGMAEGTVQVLTSDQSASAADVQDSSSSKGFFSRLGEMIGIASDDETSVHYHEGVRRGGALVVVKTADDQVDRVVTVMQRHGAVDINERAESWRQEGATAHQTPSATVKSAHIPADTTVKPAHTTVKSAVRTSPSGTTQKEEVALPVIEEELRVGKRVVQRGGVRVYTNVTERPVEESIRLREEHVSVDRHPVDRPVTDADLRSFQQGTFEVTERAEEVVVSKQARIVEEVVVSKQVAERTETVQDTVRRTDVEVEQIPLGNQAKVHSAG